EAMVMTDFSEDKITQFPQVEKFDTIVIGPGLGTDSKTFQAFEEFLSETDLTNKKLIIDADGLNLLGNHPELIEKLPPETILTPHDKELERMMGPWETSFEKIEKLQNWAQEKKLIIVSKGFF